MGSRNSDDPMDLGPFLQNYVMKNPFDQIGLAADKDNLAAAKTLEKTGGKEKYVPILPKPTSVSQERDEEPSEKRVKMEEKREENKENGRELSGRESDPEERDCPSPGRLGHIGGHVGSNVAYAMNLRHNKVSDVHVEPQHWLWRNFRYVPKYKGLFSVNDLLGEIQSIFPHITSIVLSRIMKFTFPHCPKITNKAGLFYPGLVGKPRDEYYRDAHLLAAASTVQNGLHTFESAAKAFEVSEEAIASLVLWGEEEESEGIGITDLLEEETQLLTRSPNKRRSPGAKSSRKPTEDEEWRPPVKVENKTGQSPRHSLRQRAGKLTFIDPGDSQEDSDLDVSSNKHASAPPVSHTTTPTRARKRKSTPLKATVRTTQDLTLEKTGDRVVSNNGSGGTSVDVRDVRRSDRSDGSLPDRDQSELIATGVHIKEEPRDSGYGESPRSPRPGPQSGGQSPEISVPGCSRAGGTAPEQTDGKLKTSDSQPSNVDQRTLRKLVEKIKRQEMRNKSLHRELEESLREKRSLQEQLHSRDEQIAELATAFFSLNNQFQMIAHRFKMALSANALDRNLDVLEENDNDDPS